MICDIPTEPNQIPTRVDCSARVYLGKVEEESEGKRNVCHEILTTCL